MLSPKGKFNSAPTISYPEISIKYYIQAKLGDVAHASSKRYLPPSIVSDIFLN